MLLFLEQGYSESEKNVKYIIISNNSQANKSYHLAITRTTSNELHYSPIFLKVNNAQCYTTYQTLA